MNASKRKSRKSKQVRVVAIRTYPLTAKHCATCNKKFYGIERALYCERPCRNRAYYARKTGQDQLSRSASRA